MLLEPVPNRECGPCNICCKVPTIVEPEFTKPPGVLCQHWAGGCTIYKTRPGPCRGHFCAWRRIEQLGDEWRPDISNIYAEVKTEPNEQFKHVLPDAAFALKFTVLGNLDGARMDMLIATIDQLIGSAVPIILSVAAPPGFMGGYRLLNPELAALAGREDFADALVQILRTLIATPPIAVRLP